MQLCKAFKIFQKILTFGNKETLPYVKQLDGQILSAHHTHTHTQGWFTTMKTVNYSHLSSSEKKNFITSGSYDALSIVRALCTPERSAYNTSTGETLFFSPETGTWETGASGVSILRQYLLDPIEAYAEKSGHKNLIKALHRTALTRDIISFIPQNSALHVTTDNMNQANKYLVGLENGVVDLSTMTLRSYEPNDYITCRLSFEFDPQAKHKLVDKIFSAFDIETQNYARYLSGVSLLRQQDGARPFLHVLQGAGANGKSAFLSALLSTGESQVLEDGQTLTQKADSFRDASIIGARGLYIEEVPQNISSMRVKTLAGTPTLTARPLYSQSITFKATHTAIAATNFLPSPDTLGYAEARRIKVISMTQHFEPDSTFDIQLNSVKFKQAFFLARAKAAHKYLTSGAPEVPAKVERDTQAWLDAEREEQDSISAFLSEKTVKDGAWFSTLAELNSAYRAYCATQGQKPAGKGELKAEVESWMNSQFHNGKRAKMKNGSGSSERALKIDGLRTL